MNVFRTNFRWMGDWCVAEQSGSENFHQVENFHSQRNWPHSGFQRTNLRWSNQDSGVVVILEKRDEQTPSDFTIKDWTSVSFNWITLFWTMNQRHRSLTKLLLNFLLFKKNHHRPEWCWRLHWPWLRVFPPLTARPFLAVSYQERWAAR